VPPPLRSWVWMEVSGAAARKAAVSANYFQNMVKAGEVSPFLKEIDQVRAHGSSRGLQYKTPRAGLGCVPLCWAISRWCAWTHQLCYGSAAGQSAGTRVSLPAGCLHCIHALLQANCCGATYQSEGALGRTQPQPGVAVLLLPCCWQDLPHTFPNHPWLQQAEGRTALRQVLAAYSVHNDKVGSQPGCAPGL
jgi:hypothetical protein